jgi:predicted nucleic acid-binding protein
MVLVDTSVWVAHLRDNLPGLQTLLKKGEVLCHPFIIGELACGNLKNRREILELLEALPSGEMAEHNEVLKFIEQRRLMGRGLGYVDVHLLASVLLSNCLFWTRDRRLKETAASLHIAHP